MRVWVNGGLVDGPSTPVVRADDHGLTVGDGVFETLKVIEGIPFALTRHLARLQRSGTGMGLPAVAEADVRDGVDAVLAGFEAPLGRLRITHTAGPAPMGSGRGSDGATLVIVAEETPRAPLSTSVVVAPWPRNDRSPLAGLKTTSYGENVVALAWATERGCSEALLANLAGDLCEGTGSNVGYVIDGVAYTPTLASGCLAGITRQLAIEWCGLVERDAPVEVLMEAEEVFLMSSLRDIQAVVQVGDRELPVGPRTSEMARTWAEQVASQIDP